MKDLILFSDGSSLSVSIEETAKNLDYDVKVLMINEGEISLPDLRDSKTCSFFIATSPSHLNILKANLIKIAKLKGYELINIFDESVRYSDSCCFGKNIYLSKNVILRENTVIGDGVFIGSSSLVEPNSTLAQCAEIGSGVIVMANSSIGRNTFIADKVIIKSISIGDYCYISNAVIQNYDNSVKSNTYFFPFNSSPVEYIENS